MAFTQQFTLDRRITVDGGWTVTQDDDLPNVDGTRSLTANRTTTNKWTILGNGDMSGGGDEGAQINSTNNGVSWSESGISQVGYGNNAHESPKRITWNGSTSSPRWMAGNTFYPDSDTTNSGGSNPTIITTTNLTSWSRLLLPIDNTYCNSCTINQGITDTAYNNGTWAALNSATGNVSVSSNNGSSWSSWKDPLGGYISGMAIVAGASNQFAVGGRSGRVGYSSNNGSSFNNYTIGSGSPNRRRWFRGHYFPYEINVGNTRVGPNVWVFAGAMYANAYSGLHEILCYSTNGTSWTELNVDTRDSNNVTNCPDPGSNFLRSYRTIVDTGKGLWLRWLANAGTWQLWGSYHSLTEWHHILDYPSGSYYGASISWLNRDLGLDYWNGRLVNGSNSGHICYLDFH